jgi:hypothetical protein
VLVGIVGFGHTRGAERAGLVRGMGAMGVAQDFAHGAVLAAEVEEGGYEEGDCCAPDGDAYNSAR